MNSFTNGNNITSIMDVGNYYWLASTKSSTNLYIIYSGGVLESSSYNCYGIRPIVEMNDGVYVASGSGTESDPYVLGKD